MKQKITKTKIAIRSIIAGAICLLAICFVGQKSITKAQTVETKRYKPELVVQTGHAGKVNTIKFSPDGKILASGSEGDIKLWNFETGQLIKSLEGHAERVFSVAFSPDGKILASGGEDNTIKLWSMETGELINTLNVYGWTGCVAFSPDGKTLVSSGLEKTIKLWDVETGEQIKALEGHTQSLWTVAFSPDGKIIASGGFDKTVKLWNVETGQTIKTFQGSTSRDIKTVAFSADGKILASGSDDGSIKLWDVETGQLTKSFIHGFEVQSVAFSKDNKTLASGSWDYTIKLWDVRTGQLLKSFKTDSKETTFANSVEFSPDGKSLASGHWDRTIRLWDVEKGDRIKDFEGQIHIITSVAFSPDGKFFASGNSGNTVKLWDIETGQQIKSFGIRNYAILDTDNISSIAFSPNGKILASGSVDKTIRLWNVETGQFIKSFQTNSLILLSIAFSPDGKILASGSGDKTIKLWDVATGSLIKSFSGHVSWVKSVAFSPDGKFLLSGSFDNSIRLWNIQTGRQVIDPLIGHTSSVWSVAFSPDGKTFISGGEDRLIGLWDVKTKQPIKVFIGHTDMVSAVAFSPDGKTIVSGSYDKTVKLWDVETGQEIKTFYEHNNIVKSVAFSPDGNLILSGGDDSTLKLWSISDDKSLITLTSLDENDWVATTIDGRFDTNKDLSKIEGLIWVLPDQPLIPKPLELYMRQYYEPGLLPRVLRCNEENNCDTEFKPLPSIAEINRVQPRVEIREIKPNANKADLVDVVVEVESRAEEIAQKELTSGVFDLRLFRDGQLVGTSAKSADLEEYINSAPQAVEKDRAAKSLLNTEEDKAWRKANDLQNAVKFDKNKATFVFENVRLPHDGRNQIEFSAYAFNDDRVKSETSRKTFEIKSPTVRKVNTYVISIGVNASENPAYNLNYAANDALQTQAVLGERLQENLKGTGAKLIQIPLISDYGKDGKLTATATKPIIKAVFELLAGNQKQITDRDLLKQIPVTIDGKRVEIDNANAEILPPVQPEDTLIITYSGHGYADQNGIFYLLPYDVGKDTKTLTTASLPNLISSDELSLWMREVTAREMIFVVDACHSAAAVQGDGFKPGPMGSRGLGQLSYDKGMKILSATQADNVALELGNLKQGLLSYALLQDGIFKKLANTIEPQDNKLFVREWLKYGEQRVPALYGDIKNGIFKDVKIDGQTPDAKQRSAVFCVDKQCRENVQQPKLFDFNEKRADSFLINLP